MNQRHFESSIDFTTWSAHPSSRRPKDCAAWWLDFSPQHQPSPDRRIASRESPWGPSGSRHQAKTSTFQRPCSTILWRLRPILLLVLVEHAWFGQAWFDQSVLPPFLSSIVFWTAAAAFAAAASCIVQQCEKHVLGFLRLLHSVLGFALQRSIYTLHLNEELKSNKDLFLFPGVDPLDVQTALGPSRNPSNLLTFHPELQRGFLDPLLCYPCALFGFKRAQQ